METSETVNKMPVEVEGEFVNWWNEYNARTTLFISYLYQDAALKLCYLLFFSSFHNFFLSCKTKNTFRAQFWISVWCSKHISRLEISRSSNSLIDIHAMLNLLWILLECSTDSYHQSVCLQVVLLFMVQCLNQISCEWRWNLKRRPVSFKQSPAPALKTLHLSDSMDT